MSDEQEPQAPRRLRPITADPTMRRPAQFCSLDAAHEAHDYSVSTGGPRTVITEQLYWCPGGINIDTAEADPVNHPAHYRSHPSGIECIEITEHMGFNLGNALKYLWRADLKGDAIEDLRKAAWYVQREIDKRAAAAGQL